MKIALDIQSVAQQCTGIGYYTRALIREYNSVEGIDFYYYRDSRKADLDTLERLSWENLSLRNRARKDDVDILHIPGFAGPYLKGRFKRITTVHDLIGMIYPRNLAPVSRFYWQKWLPACVKRSDFIIADSENTKKDIVKFLNISAEKIKVICLAADERFKPIDKSSQQRQSLKDYGIDKDYILNVGTIEPRKNITGLIEAFGGYLKESRREDLLLVIAGKKGWDYQKCYQKAVELGLKDRVIFCDYVKDEDLPILYNFAEIFVYPSFYEGFGLPVLEAMSCGCAVITSKRSSLPEITAEAAVFAEPDNVDSIKSALATLLEDGLLRKRLSKEAIEQSKKFSWDKTAAETIKTYKELLS